jgi:ankyrin repeat protein
VKSDIKRLLSSKDTDVKNEINFLKEKYLASELLYNHKHLAHIIISSKRIDILILLLEYWPESFFVQNSVKSSPLYYALKRGYTDAIKLMLIIKPDLIDFIDNDYESPLNYSMKNNQLEIFSLMIRLKPNSIDYQDQDQQSLLINSLKDNKFEFFKFLLEQGSNQNFIAIKNNNILHFIASLRDQRYLQLIEDKQIIISDQLINYVNDKKNTALHLAFIGLLIIQKNGVKCSIDSSNNDVKFYRKFIEILFCLSNPDTSICNHDGNNIIHLCARIKDDDLLELIVQRSNISSLNILDSHNKSALDYACESQNYFAIDLLLSKKVNQTCVYLSSILQESNEQNNKPVIDYLFCDQSNFFKNLSVSFNQYFGIDTDSLDQEKQSLTIDKSKITKIKESLFKKENLIKIIKGFLELKKTPIFTKEYISKEKKIFEEDFLKAINITEQQKIQDFFCDFFKSKSLSKSVKPRYSKCFKEMYSSANPRIETMN